MLGVRLTKAADNDIVEILRWSEAQFGSSARTRYEQLILAGILDVSTEPLRPGSITRPEFGEGVGSWHLRLSRNRAPREGHVQRPRHFLIYKSTQALLVVGRVLHDSMELEQHLHQLDTWD